MKTNIEQIHTMPKYFSRLECNVQKLQIVHKCILGFFQGTKINFASNQSEYKQISCQTLSPTISIKKFPSSLTFISHELGNKHRFNSWEKLEILTFNVKAEISQGEVCVPLHDLQLYTVMVNDVLNLYFRIPADGPRLQESDTTRVPHIFFINLCLIQLTLPRDD